MGIHASTIKIVSVYEGSVVLNYDIVADDSDSGSSAQAQAALAKVQAKQTAQFATGQMNLGAPILDVQASVVSSEVTSSNLATSTPAVTRIISGGVVTAPGYDPIVITNVAQAEEVVGGVFVPDIPIMQVTTTYVNQINQTIHSEEIVQQLNRFQSDEDYRLKATTIYS